MEYSRKNKVSIFETATFKFRDYTPVSNMRSVKPELLILQFAALLALTACGEGQTPSEVAIQAPQTNQGQYQNPEVTVDGTAAASSEEEPPQTAANIGDNEPLLLSNTYQLVTDGLRSGEGYFSADGRRFIYQSEETGDNPFYQIYLRDLVTGNTSKVSPGIGLTTCSWVHPTLDRIIFASTHGDPDATLKQADEIAVRASGEERAYAWDYDLHYDIYQSDLDGSGLINLTNAPGYDAEGSYSSDGSRTHRGGPHTLGHT